MRPLDPERVENRDSIAPEETLRARSLTAGEGVPRGSGSGRQRHSCGDRGRGRREVPSPCTGAPTEPHRFGFGVLDWCATPTGVAAVEDAGLQQSGLAALGSPRGIRACLPDGARADGDQPCSWPGSERPCGVARSHRPASRGAHEPRPPGPRAGKARRLDGSTAPHDKKLRATLGTEAPPAPSTA